MPFDSEVEVNQKSRYIAALEKARDRLARGWCQGALNDGAGNVCAIGALAETGGFAKKGDSSRLFDALGTGPLQLVEWNNVPGRTQAEVLARFDEAIERLRAE